MKNAWIVLCCLLSLCFVACHAPASSVQAMPTPVRGMLFMDTNATSSSSSYFSASGLSAALMGNNTSGNNVGDGKMGNKVGEAECKGYLTLIAQGDCSVATAAKNGGITNIGTVDHRIFNILGLYTVYTTRVTGQ